MNNWTPFDHAFELAQIQRQLSHWHRRREETWSSEVDRQSIATAANHWAQQVNSDRWGVGLREWDSRSGRLANGLGLRECDRECVGWSWREVNCGC
jgi:hypothetical protein